MKLEFATFSIAGPSGANPSSPRSTPARQHVDLPAQYGKIGISAVAAAVRYQGSAGTPDHAAVDQSADAPVRDVAA